MQLPLTSLVPTVVQLINYWIGQYPHFGNFPFWYLGQVPYVWFTGPVVPGIIALLHNFFPSVSITSIYIGFVYSVWFCLGGSGWWLFLSRLGANKRVAFWSEILFLLLPFQLVLFAVGDGLAHLALIVLLWGLVAIDLLFEKRSLLWLILAVFFGVLLLWVHLATFIVLMIGVGSLIIVKYRAHWKESLIQFLLLALVMFSVAGVWYGIRFWWVLFWSPSFAGQALSAVGISIVRQGLVLLPILAAVFYVSHRSSKMSLLMQFVVIFGSVFGILTVVRFVSDPDFWIDWVNYGLELQMVVSIIGGVVVSKYVLKGYATLILSILMIILLFTINGVFGYYFFVKEAVSIAAYKDKVVSLLSLVAESKKTVFLSGSPVFWIGEVYPHLIQVRGGRDEVVPDESWARAAYVLREGKSGVEMKSWIEKLGISYLLVSDRTTSYEYFKDFAPLNMYEGFHQVGENAGNVLYQTDVDVGTAQIQKASVSFGERIMSVLIGVVFFLLALKSEKMTQLFFSRLPSLGFDPSFDDE